MVKHLPSTEQSAIYGMEVVDFRAWLEIQSRKIRTRYLTSTLLLSVFAFYFTGHPALPVLMWVSFFLQYPPAHGPESVLRVFGYFFHSKLREEVFDNSANDLTQDWLDARRRGIWLIFLYPVFFIRVCLLVACTGLVAAERVLRRLPCLAILFKFFGK